MTESDLAGPVDYEVALLKTLADLPGGQGKSGVVADVLFDRYRDVIPIEHRLSVGPNRTDRWRIRITQARNKLKNCGLLDAPSRGVWCITQAGRDWLAQNPDAWRLDSHARQPAERAGCRAPARRARSGPTLDHNSDIPDVTLEKLQRIRQALPAEDFQRDWGATYDALLAQRRVDPVSVVSDGQILNAIHKLIGNIHAYLRGSLDFEPTMDDLCDWAYVCKLLRFDAEARVLLVIAEVSSAMMPDGPNSEARTVRLDEQFEEDDRLWKGGARDPSPSGHLLVFIHLVYLKRQRSAGPLSPDQDEEYRQYERRWTAICVSANTRVSDQVFLRLARKEIAAIRRCVRQKIESLPAASALADWIYLSYVLEMYPEGSALWRFISQEELDPWRYERVKKLATICQRHANDP